MIPDSVSFRRNLKGGYLPQIAKNREMNGSVSTCFLTRNFFGGKAGHFYLFLTCEWFQVLEKSLRVDTIWLILSTQTQEGLRIRALPRPGWIRSFKMVWADPLAPLISNGV